MPIRGTMLLVFGFLEAAPVDALGNFTPFVNMGIGGIFLYFYLLERKERRDQKIKDEARYEMLLTRLFTTLEEERKRDSQWYGRHKGDS